MCSIGPQTATAVRIVPKSKPIIAYRFWQVSRYGFCSSATPRRQRRFRLQPTFRFSAPAWDKRLAHANVVPAPRPATSILTGPSRRDWDGGLYAYRTRKAAMADVKQGSPYGYGYAFGTVELWGAVVEHENGYRAEHARVRSIERVFSHLQNDSPDPATGGWHWHIAPATAYDREVRAALRRHYRLRPPTARTTKRATKRTTTRTAKRA